IYAALHRAGYAAVPWSQHAGDGQALHGARIVAAVRCAPPANKPTTSERATCAPWLDRDLELALPPLRGGLALGSIGFGAFLRATRRGGWAVPGPKPRFGHGVQVPLVAPSGQVVPLIASYHVSQQNTFTGKLTEAMLDDVLARCRALTDPPPPQTLR